MMNSKRVLVLGASQNPDRYSNMAIKLLQHYNHEVIAIGNKKGEVGEVKIQESEAGVANIHTVTLYLGLQNQTPYHEFIKSLKPARVIFNPGTENYSFMRELESKGIETVEGCTLVMLHSGEF